MVVVVIIAVLAAIAVPLFAGRLRSRHLLQIGGRIADIYRGSRTRALARGSAMVVSLSMSDGSFQVLEGVEGTNAATSSGANKAACANLPTRGCLTNAWGNVGSGSTVGTARVVDGMASPGIKPVLTLSDGTVVKAGTVAICFSPAGRTYINTTATWTPDQWQTLGAPAVLDITSTDPNNQTARDYQVLIMPNGTARLAP
ncbi:MAG TPA: hypothetical protein VMI54_16040 [Polyangiaceae bacterium]|nr:hypothetical protein [Polyangiaceae bacterium]